jgi:hypothetical protein
MLATFTRVTRVDSTSVRIVTIYGFVGTTIFRITVIIGTIIVVITEDWEGSTTLTTDTEDVSTFTEWLRAYEGY